jgi:hypothetical protein
MEAGDRLGRLFKVQWAPPVSAGIGTLVLSLFSSIFALVPCVGWVLPTVIAIVGLGGVFLTRFGMRDAQSSGPTSMVPSTPAQPPANPAPPAAPFVQTPPPAAPDLSEPPAQPDDFLPPAE